MSDAPAPDEDAAAAERERRMREGVAQSIRTHCAIVDEPTLLMYLGACAAQLALRREFESPEAAVRDMLDRGAFRVDDWPKEAGNLRTFSRLIRGQYIGVGLAFSQADASRN